MSFKRVQEDSQSKQGFTVIEVMLFLALSGMLLIGVLSGVYASIATQRYNDSVRSFAEFLRQTYSEVISPESLGEGNSDDYAVYGKVVVFGLNNETKVYTATLVGDTEIPSGSGDFLWELAQVNAKLFCGSEDNSHQFESTVNSYAPLWQTRIDNTSKNLLQGTVIIARSPTSGTVHTIFADKLTFDLSAPDGCQPGPGNQTASHQLQTAILNNSTTNAFQMTDVNFCLKSDDSNIIRDVLLATDGHNTSAINILNADDGRSQCR